MFGGKDHRRILLGVAIIICSCFYGVAVKTVGNRKPEAGRVGKSDEPSPRQTLRRIYTSQIGVREATGRNDGPEVKQYLRYVSLDHGNAWCAAFVSWVFGQAGMGGPKTAWSPALFPAKRVIWGALHKKNSLVGETHSIPLRSTQADVKVGDIFGIYFSELRRIAHCGFIDKWDGTWCITVEGNTNDIGSVTTEQHRGNPIRAGPGEGVYRKKRLVKTIYKVADWIQ